MYIEHYVFETPSDENVTIWRYLDFTKFVSLLDRQQLFFARVDTLDDPFEGSYPKGNIVLRQENVNYEHIPQELRDMESLVMKDRDIPKATRET